MIFWGWIPSLVPRFDLKYPEDSFAVILADSLRCKTRNADDSDDRNLVRIIMDGDPSEFEYGSECVRIRIENGGFQVRTAVTVYETGMVRFDVVESIGPRQMSDDETRHMVRELYFVIKNIFHMDIHHPRDADEGPDSLSHGDENFSIVQADDLREAVDRTFMLIMRKCESGLERYSRNIEGVDGLVDMAMYNILTGFLAYGRNFLNVFRDVLGD